MLDEAAVAEVTALVADAAQPVVMFALEWCEFCWSVRKVLARYSISYRAVDLDSVAYQQDNRDGKLRQALRARTSSNNFPQRSDSPKQRVIPGLRHRLHSGEVPLSPPRFGCCPVERTRPVLASNMTSKNSWAFQSLQNNHDQAS